MTEPFDDDVDAVSQHREGINAYIEYKTISVPA